MNLEHELVRAINRRHFFGRTGAGLGLGAIALASLLQDEARGRAVDIPGRSEPEDPLAPKKSPLPARAKHVIYLHMAGSPSQLDLFDDKPALRKFDGKPCPQELLKGKRFAFISGVPNMLGSPFRFGRHGQSGTELSQLWTHLPGVIDEIAVLKSMQTDQFNHAPAQLFLHTGTNLFGGASMGSWATYGLGTENRDLPGFVVLTSGGKTPDAGKSVWGSGFLPSVYQGVQCGTQGDPVLSLSVLAGQNHTDRTLQLDGLRQD